MPEHVFTVAAVGHSVDAQSNTLTLFSILEQVGSVQFPGRIPQLTVATLWRRQEGEQGVPFIQRIRLVGPDGTLVGEFENTCKFERARHRMLTILGNLPFNKIGLHRFEVYIKREDAQDWGSPVTSYPINVTATERPGEESLLPSDEADVMP